jgi:murein L,D-transpeptidase YcbB/YkuD
VPASVRTAIASGTLPGAQHGDLARYRAALLRLYGDSAARPLWIGARGPTSQARAVLAALTLAPTHGLRAGDYDAGDLARIVPTLATTSTDADARADTEQLMRTDAWLSLSLMRFADQLEHGRVDPRTLGFALSVERPSRDYAGLVTALSRADDPTSILGALEPSYPRYHALRNVLASYRALAADTSLDVAAGLSTRRTIRPGDAWPGVAELSRYLRALGEMPAGGGAPADSFSGAVVDGVRRFQQHHGLEPDGVLGPATIAELRVPLSRRVVQIELALERWRWLPHDLPPRVAVVNIPGFRLYAFDRTKGSDRPVARLDVIVGSAFDRRHTPVFVSTMTRVVFQPYWDVPRSIARNEEVPRLRRDPGYADRAGFEIVRGGDVGATIFPLTSANLDRVVAGTLRLRQRPGPANALGPVKFVFPNAYNVYLHGTPAQSLFERPRRDFSHGCVRVSEPARLAEFVLEGEAGWDAERIAAAMCIGEPMRVVQLARPLPVYMLYTTVVPDDTGVPNFYPDIYGHDARLARALGLR